MHGGIERMSVDFIDDTLGLYDETVGVTHEYMHRISTSDKCSLSIHTTPWIVRTEQRVMNKHSLIDCVELGDADGFFDRGEIFLSAGLSGSTTLGEDSFNSFGITE